MQSLWIKYFQHKNYVDIKTTQKIIDFRKLINCNQSHQYDTKKIFFAKKVDNVSSDGISRSHVRALFTNGMHQNEIWIIFGHLTFRMLSHLFFIASSGHKIFAIWYSFQIMHIICLFHDYIYDKNILSLMIPRNVTRIFRN